MSKKKIDFLHQDNYLDEEVAPVIKIENNDKLVEENKKLKLENEKFKAEIERLKSENEKLVEEVSNAEEESSNKEEIETYINMAKRIQADFDNYRKRNVEAIKQAKEDGVATTIREMLGCVDAIDKAIEYTKDQDTIIGLKMISDKFVKFLSEFGVKKYESIGKPFDAAVHSAVSSMEKEGTQPNMVIEEIVSGYMMGSKVLRYALVVISK